MTDITKDQAVIALILWERLCYIADRHLSERDKCDFAVSPGARHAVLDMAEQVDAVFRLLPPEEQERATRDHTFYHEMVDSFDYLNPDGPVLTHPPQVLADWFEANFGITDAPSMQR